MGLEEIMGAGISKEQKSRIASRELTKVQKDLEKAGIGVYREKGALIHYENKSDGSGFNISFRWIHASNGECAGWPVVYLGSMNPIAPGKVFSAPSWLPDSWEDGIRVIKQTHTPKVVLQPDSQQA